MKFIEKMFLYWHLLLLHCNNSYIALKSTEWFYFGSQMSWKCCLPISTSFKLILWTIGIFTRYNSVEIEGAGCCCFRAYPTSRQGLKTDPPREDIDFQHWKMDEFGVLLIHIFDYFWWSKYCKDMALNPSISELMGFHVESKGTTPPMPTFSRNKGLW